MTAFKLLPLFTALVLAGCASVATRTSIPPEQAHRQHVIAHDLDPAVAFQRVEIALAEIYTSLPSILQLSQPASGTLIVRPLLTYSVMGVAHDGRYTLKITVGEREVACDYTLHPSGPYNAYPPAVEMPAIESQFRIITADLARAVEGRLQP